jgi:FAD/FMN-containing dehydrogenase
MDLALVEALGRGLPAERLVIDPDVLAAISHDDAEWAPTGQAAVGVRARSEAEVQYVVRTCAELGTPIVPRGAGTAHAGDGNLHPLLVTPAGDEAARLEAQAAFEELLDAAIALGGTVTGEHGVGILKRDGMRRELDPGSLALQSAVRRALDPREIFNPGKG